MSRHYLSFPYTTHMTFQRRVHLPPYPISISFQREFSDFVVIYFCDTLCKFIFGSHKISTIISSNRSYISSPNNESSQCQIVSKLFVFSTWMARQAKHVKSAPYRFRFVLLSLISNRPNMFTPQ